MSRVPSDPKAVVTQIRQSPKEKEKWQSEADAQGVKLSALVRHAVNEYINRRKKQQK